MKFDAKKSKCEKQIAEKNTDRSRKNRVSIWRVWKDLKLVEKITPLKANKTSILYKIYSPKYTSFPQVGHFGIVEETKAEYLQQALRVRELHQNSNIP